MKTAVISSKTSVNHLTGDGHPEQPKRVTVITERLKKNKSLIWDKPISFNENILKKAHDENYVSMVEKSFPSQGLKFLDGDTIISPGSKDATVDAVGSVIKAIDGVEQKKFRNAFCAVRPPGHHAEKNKAMGFCIYNNCAVAAHYLMEKYKYKKIAIFDPDVHHGNGTQDIFSIIKMFCTYLHTNIHFIQALEAKKKKVSIIIFSMYLFLLGLHQRNI